MLWDDDITILFSHTFNGFAQFSKVAAKKNLGVDNHGKK